MDLFVLTLEILHLFFPLELLPHLIPELLCLFYFLLPEFDCKFLPILYYYEDILLPFLKCPIIESFSSKLTDPNSPIKGIETVIYKKKDEKNIKKKKLKKKKRLKI